MFNSIKKDKLQQIKSISVKNLKTKLILVVSLSLLLITCFAPTKARAIDVESDPRNDLYRITALDFLYVIGDEFPDIPNEADDITDLVNKMILRSREVSDPGSIDIREGKIHHGPLFDYFQVDMEDDIDDLDYVIIYAFIESHVNNRWIGLRLELDGTEEYFEYRAYGDIEEDNATGAFTDNTAWMAFNATHYYYREGDTVLVMSMTGNADFSNPLKSMVYYDFCPNSDVEEKEGTYAGTDPITQFFDDIADFLFGNIFDGAIPFMILIALLLVLGQVLFDRKNRYAHWIGFAGLLFLCFPIVMYAISINLVGIMGVPNLLGILEVFVLVNFLVFVTCSMLNNWSVFRRYLWAILVAFVLIDIEQIVYMCIYTSQMQIIAVILISIGSVLLYALLRFSRNKGRHAKNG